MKFRATISLDQLENYFLYFKVFLDDLGFSQANAADAFMLDYQEAWIPWDDVHIPLIFQRVALENARKYEMMCAIFTAEYEPLVNYDRTETEQTTRSPNLTTARSGSSNATDSRTTQTNQIEHRADKPKAPEGQTWQEVTEHQVAPYDSSTYNNAEKDIREETGWRETETSYTGEPDTDITSRVGSENFTTTETGNERHSRTLTAKGNIGTMTVQDMANQELDLAQRLNVFREIERDLAAKLFLQVW